jgi:SAM-dependent methyltransferase
MLTIFSRYRVHQMQAIAYLLLARMAGKRCFGYAIIKARLQGKSGLEFGGPSSIFSANHLVPLYNIVSAIDTCNFAQQTIWSSQEDRLRFGPSLRKQLIAEACEASLIASDCYDFVAASHVLEHVANPLRALQEWKRLVKPSGTILLLVPHKAGMFDHRRRFTTFDHIKKDFESNVAETDLTHLQEILELHDLELDPPSGSAAQFRERCSRNLSNRAMHHHVFSPELLIEMFSFLGMRILNIAVERPYHTIVHAEKANQTETARVHLENAAFLDPEAGWLKQNPFRSGSKARLVEGSRE